jgi:molybdate transport system substrate-binding protein
MRHPGTRRDLLGLAATVLAGTPALAQPAPLTVFAAASLQDGLRVLEPLWRQGGGERPPLRFSFAASSALARQIEQGAPADLFASADEDWMDYLATRELIRPETRIAPLGNALVLVAPADRPLEVALAPGVDLAALLGPQGRLAIGDPAHVPAGRYARQALIALGAWEAVVPRLARAGDVRAALLLVQRGEAPLGIVYATDAAAVPGIRIAGRFPEDSHTPITYPFALTRRAAPAAAALLALLTGPEAAPVWRRLGFQVRS